MTALETIETILDERDHEDRRAQANEEYRARRLEQLQWRIDNGELSTARALLQIEAELEVVNRQSKQREALYRNYYGNKHSEGASRHQ